MLLQRLGLPDAGLDEGDSGWRQPDETHLLIHHREVDQTPFLEIGQVRPNRGGEILPLANEILLGYSDVASCPQAIKMNQNPNRPGNSARCCVVRHTSDYS